MSNLSAVERIALTLALAVLTAGPALAGSVGPGAPAPLVGAGIPALAAFAGGYWAIRRRRRR